MRRLGPILSVCAAALVGCTSTSSAPVSAPAAASTYVPVDLTSEWVSIVRAGLRSRLKDPQSAQFGIMRASVDSRGGGEILSVCGYVNARNSFGGYTGQQPFFGLLNKPTPTARGGFGVLSIGSDSIKAAAIFDTCAKRMINI